MNVFFSALFIYIFLLLPMSAGAAPRNNLPMELMYRGKPIDPLCLFEIEHRIGVVDLSVCGLGNKKKSILGRNKQLISQGFVGYDYSMQVGGTDRFRGYSYYKSLGTFRDSVIVQTINNSGGTGAFSFLNIVQRDGNRIKISVLNGGDRCNGSIVDLQRQGTGDNEYLVYGVQLTPYDVLMLTKDNPFKLKAYDDLSACALCCVGTAVFQRHIGADFSQEKLLYVDVSTYLQNIASSSPQHYQACFDRLLSKYGKKNNGKLDAQQLLLFTHEFNAQCLS